MTRIEAMDDPSADDVAVLGRGLGAFNADHGVRSKPRTFAVFLRDADGAIKGGIEAIQMGASVYLKRVWIDAALRGRGTGLTLMRAIEEEARTRGAKLLWLETLSFQARGFYEKAGYSVFGTISHPPAAEDVPFSSFFMQKLL